MQAEVGSWPARRLAIALAGTLLDHPDGDQVFEMPAQRLAARRAASDQLGHRGVAEVAERAQDVETDRVGDYV
jgi:hypothetical protein